MSKRTKRDRRQPATDAHPETLSHQFSDRQYSRYDHRQLTGEKPKAVKADLPANMPRPLKRALAKSIARLERLAARGKDVPGIELDYRDTEGGMSTFVYLPGELADRIAEDVIVAALALRERRRMQA